MEPPTFSNISSSSSSSSSSFGCYLHHKSACSMGISWDVTIAKSTNQRCTWVGAHMEWPQGGKNPWDFHGNMCDIFHPFPHWFNRLTGKRHISLTFPHYENSRIRWSWIDFLDVTRWRFFGATSWDPLATPSMQSWAIGKLHWNLMYWKMQKFFYSRAGMVPETWIGHSWTSNMILTLKQ